MLNGYVKIIIIYLFIIFLPLLTFYDHRKKKTDKKIPDSSNNEFVSKKV